MSERVVYTGLACFALVLVCGCAKQSSYRFAEVQASVDVSGPGKVVVAVVDSRPFVISGEKAPTFVGVTRDDRKVVDWRTASNKPLADDMAEAICRSLRRRGFDASALPTEVNSPENEVVSEIAGATPDLGLLVDISQWRSDVYVDVILKYDLSIHVLSPEGEEVASHAVDSEEDLTQGTANPKKHAKRAIPRAFKRVLEALLDSEPVSSAMSKLKDGQNEAVGPLISPAGPAPISGFCETVLAMNDINRVQRSPSAIGALEGPKLVSWLVADSTIKACRDKKTDQKGNPVSESTEAAEETSAFDRAVEETAGCVSIDYLLQENPAWCTGEGVSPATRAAALEVLSICRGNLAIYCGTWFTESSMKGVDPASMSDDIPVFKRLGAACGSFPLSSGIAPKPETLPPTESDSPAPEPETAEEYLGMRALKDARNKGLIDEAEFQRRQEAMRAMREKELRQLKLDLRASRIDELEYEIQVYEVMKKYE